MLLKKRNLVIEINDENEALIEKKIKEGFNEYKGKTALKKQAEKEEKANDENNNNK